MVVGYRNADGSANLSGYNLPRRAPLPDGGPLRTLLAVQQAGGQVAWLDGGVGRGRRFPLVEVAVWWVLLFGGYLALVSPLSGGEFILGALLSVVAARAGVLARRASDSSFTVSWRWLGSLVKIPGAVLADTLLLARLLWPQWRRRESPSGALRGVLLAQQPDDVREASWQAVAGLMLSLSPASFVVDSGGQPPALLVHAVRGRSSAMERSVQR
jgi:multisubunit Na+/H+ antiporter MnhE subunit